MTSFHTPTSSSMIIQARRWNCGRPISLANNAVFAVIREAMRGKDMVALGRVVILKSM
jgi:hypothetical protein